MNWDTATNVALAPHLYEPAILKDAIALLARDRDLHFEDARRFGMHHPRGRTASKNANRVHKMIRACKKAL